MGKEGNGEGGLKTLESLVNQGQPGQTAPPQVEDLALTVQEEHTVEVVDALLNEAARLTGTTAKPPTGDIFDMQDLLAAAQEELRVQVRDMVVTRDQELEGLRG